VLKQLKITLLEPERRGVTGQVKTGHCRAG
jgi:hypothetical protein